jgi:predicted dehydrogenase
MSTLTRRQFIGGTALGTAAAVAARFPSLAQSNGPVLRLGLIGCGGYGRTDLRKAFQAGGVDLVAVCDVDSAHAKQVAEDAEKQQGHRPREFKHYQELLDQTELDILILATPAHWHALPFIAACKKKLNIYCEKPLAYDVRESRAMVQAAQEHGNLVQIGFQRRSSDTFKQAREFIRRGGAGRIVCAVGVTVGVRP